MSDTEYIYLMEPYISGHREPELRFDVKVMKGNVIVASMTEMSSDNGHTWAQEYIRGLELKDALGVRRYMAGGSQ